MPMTPSRIENTIPPIITASERISTGSSTARKRLHRDLHFAVVHIGDPIQHLLESAGFLADQDHLRGKPRIQPGFAERPAEALALAQAHDHAVERAGEHAVARSFP